MTQGTGDAALRAGLARLVRGEALAEAEAAEIFREIVAGAADPAQIGALAVALAIRGETAAVIAGAAAAMREAVVRVPLRSDGAIDTCGTGGSGVPRRNVSTAVAIAAAACGARVAKHGNRGISSPCGSADVLAALGVDITAPPERVARCVDEVGVGFLFAPSLHPAMRHAAAPRRALGLRTIFNLLGPMSNPAGVRRQVIGVYDPAKVEAMAAGARRRGRALPYKCAVQRRAGPAGRGRRGRRGAAGAGRPDRGGARRRAGERSARAARRDQPR